MLYKVEYGVVDVFEWFGGLELAAIAGRAGKTEDFLSATVGHVDQPVMPRDS
jgi:hypothetical protein